MWTHLLTVGLVPDELEAWNALLVAHHPDIFWMFAVRHSKAIGFTLSQTLLSTGAVHIVKPDTAWNRKSERTNLGLSSGFGLLVKLNVQFVTCMCHKNVQNNEQIICEENNY